MFKHQPNGPLPTYGEYLVDLFITPSSQEMESPVNPWLFIDEADEVIGMQLYQVLWIRNV